MVAALGRGCTYACIEAHRSGEAGECTCGGRFMAEQVEVLDKIAVDAAESAIRFRNWESYLKSNTTMDPNTKAALSMRVRLLVETAERLQTVVSEEKQGMTATQMGGQNNG